MTYELFVDAYDERKGQNFFVNIKVNTSLDINLDDFLKYYFNVKKLQILNIEKQKIMDDKIHSVSTVLETTGRSYY